MYRVHLVINIGLSNSKIKKAKKKKNVNLDIVDGFGNDYGPFYTFKEYQIDKIAADIDIFDKKFCNLQKQNNKKKVKILIPIYPFPIEMSHYDFTINMCHIDLQNILKRRTNNNKYEIDYHWENKIKLKQNDSKTVLINKYNIIAINDMKKKIITTPDIKFINQWTVDYYFWRLTKLAAKFIDKIYCNIWKIDEKLLQKHKRLYNKWCNNTIICNDDQKRRQFVNKFLKWNIESNNDIINRFKVFRYIGFENIFHLMMKQHPYNLNKEINIVI